MAPRIFQDVQFYLSPSLLPEINDAICKELLENGADSAESIEEATHIITNSDDFDGRQGASLEAAIVTPQWVSRSIELEAMLSPQFFSASRSSLFSGVVACPVDLNENEKDLLNCAITQLGGQWRAGLTKDVTHLFAWASSTIVETTARKFPRIHILTPHWFDDCLRFSALLPVKPYLWPDPPVLLLSKPTPPQTTSNDGLTEAHRKLLKISATDPDVVERLEHGPPKRNFWKGRKILLGSSLDLRDTRRTAFEKSLTASGAQILKYKMSNGNASPEEEAALVKECDFLVTRYRDGLAYNKAARHNKIIGSIPWLLYVQATGAIVSPRDQLLHYPVPKEKVHGFAKSVTVTNYTGEAREYLKRLITTMGGDFTPTLSSKTEVVIAASSAGEKVSRARAWSLPIVNHLWLEDSFANWQMMAMTKQRYINFPPNVDFSTILAIQGLAKVPSSVDVFVPSSDGEESDNDVEMVPHSPAESATDAAEIEGIIDSPMDDRPPEPLFDEVPESSPQMKSLPSSPIAVRRSPHKSVARYQPSPKRRRTTRQDESDEDSISPVRRSTHKLARDPSPSPHPSPKKKVKRTKEDDISIGYASSDSGLAPPGQTNVKIGKPSKKSSPVKKSPVKATGSSSRTERKSKNTELTGEEQRTTKSRARAKPASKATTTSEESRESTQDPSLNASNVSIEPHRTKRLAGRKAEMQLKDAAADMIKFDREKRSKNFNRVGTTSDDFVTPSASTSKPGKKRKPVPKDSDHDNDIEEEPDSKKRTKRIKTSKSKGDEDVVIKEEKLFTQAVASKKKHHIFIVASGFHAVLDKPLKDAEGMGAKNVESKPDKCTHLILKKYARTLKTLRATTNAPWIVTDKWLLDSIRAKEFLPEGKYLLKDPDAEEKYNFQLQEALENARALKNSGHKIFEKKHFYVSPKACGEIQELLKEAVEGNGGKFTKLGYARGRMRLGYDYVVALDKEDAQWAMKDGSVPVYNRELILGSAMRQEWWENDELVLWQAPEDN